MFRELVHCTIFKLLFDVTVAISTTSRLYIGLAVRLYVFMQNFHSCSNCSISAGKGLIKKLTE